MSDDFSNNPFQERLVWQDGKLNVKEPQQQLAKPFELPYNDGDCTSLLPLHERCPVVRRRGSDGVMRASDAYKKVRDN